MSSPSLDALSLREINEYLDRALDLPEAERERWLADLAQSSPAIAARLREMLARHDALEGADFLGRTVWTEIESSQRAAMVGKRIGAYTIERLIGSGGMGEVWLASRSDGHFEARYALKFVDRLMEQPRVVERFRYEGRLLARLAHPNIARLIDAGIAEDGRQYLVLEYIDGERIDSYCDVRSLSIRERVRLFLDVVAAVAHAHTNLIIHRDLKPSNVLVTREGSAKLLDFGIAKLVGAEPDNLALTPDYAAPEQLVGEIPSTPTDVYQLGMLLRVLLTGDHPAAKEPNEKKLPADIEAILAMALRKDPSERYTTAAALGDDLKRYLNCEAVSARGGAALYVAYKFVRRHRIAVATSVAGVAGLCAALVFAFMQARVAESERDRAFALAARNEAVTSFMGTVITEAAESGKPLSVNDIVSRSEQLALANTSGNRENRAAVLGMLGTYYHTLSDYTRAAAALDRALALMDSARDSDLRSELVCVRAIVSGNMGQLDEAIRVTERELQHPPSDAVSHAACLHHRAILAQFADDPPNTLRYATAALSRLQESGRAPKDVEAKYLETVASAYYINNRHRESLEHYDMAMRDLTELGRARGAASLVLRANLGVVYEGAGMPNRALQLHEENLSVARERDPSAPPHAVLMLNRARALEAVGRYADARKEYEIVLGMSKSAQAKRVMVYSLIGLIGTNLQLEDTAAAKRYLADIQDVFGPSEPVDSIPAAKVASLRGRLHLALGEPQLALQEFERALLHKRNRPTRIEAFLGKAEAELLSGDARAAVADAQVALDIARAQQGGVQWSSRTGLAWLMLSRAQQALGNPAAQAAGETAVKHLTQTVDAAHPALLQAQSGLTGTPKR